MVRMVLKDFTSEVKDPFVSLHSHYVHSCNAIIIIIFVIIIIIIIIIIVVIIIIIIIIIVVMSIIKIYTSYIIIIIFPSLSNQTLLIFCHIYVDHHAV